MRLVVIATIFLAAVGVLVGVGLSESAVAVVDFDQLVLEPDQFRGEEVMVEAKILEIASMSPLAFTVATEGFDDHAVQVTSEVAPPENFRRDGGVMLRGVYDASKREFHATRITTKCPSRYDTEEEYKKIRAEREKEKEARLREREAAATSSS